LRVKTYFTHIDRELFNSQDNRHCILPISVGQPYHEDKKFESTLDLMNRSFKKCTILVCDTLQRYSHFTVSKDKTFEEVTEYSLMLGDEWIERNQKFIDKLTIPHEVQRWDEWLNHQGFDNCKQYVEDAYINDDDFKQELDYAVSQYVNRVFQRDNNVDLEKAKRMSISYLKEESAAFALAVTNEQCNFLIYPTIIIPVKILFNKLEFKKLYYHCSVAGIRFQKLKALT
jgi:tRNA-dependent cyclodipeptide synthase